MRPPWPSERVSRLSSVDDAVTVAGELPGDSRREQLVDDLRRHLGEALVDSVVVPGVDVWVRVRTDAWRPAAQSLRELGFTYFCFLSVIDWLPSPYGRGEDDPTEPPPERSTEIVQGVAGGSTRLQMLARLVHPGTHLGVNVKCDVPDDSPVVESWIPVFAGANWHEREAHEMFGVGFAGHPDLRNLYLPAEFEGHPLRKDFPLLARMVKPWPGIVDVEPMPAVDGDDEGGDES